MNVDFDKWMKWFVTAVEEVIVVDVKFNNRLNWEFIVKYSEPISMNETDNNLWVSSDGQNYI